MQSSAPVQALSEQVLAAKASFMRLTAGVGDERLLARPSPGAWSAAECLDHLNITGRESVVLVDKAIAELEAKSLKSDGPFRPRLLVRLFIQATEPPARFKARTGAAFSPPVGLEPEAVKSEFLAYIPSFWVSSSG